MPSIAKSWPLSALGVVPGATLTTRSDGATEGGAGGLVGELSLTLLHKLPFPKFAVKEFHAVLVLGHRLRFKGLLFLSAGMSGGDSSDLSNEGEPQATSSSALINGSGKED